MTCPNAHLHFAHFAAGARLICASSSLGSGYTYFFSSDKRLLAFATVSGICNHPLSESSCMRHRIRALCRQSHLRTHLSATVRVPFNGNSFQPAHTVGLSRLCLAQQPHAAHLASLILISVSRDLKSMLAASVWDHIYPVSTLSVSIFFHSYLSQETPRPW